MTHTPIVQKLVDYMESDPEFKKAFRNSFGLAYQTGLELFKDYNIHTLDDYINYLDTYVNWVPTEDRDGRSVYNHICLFYFILDLPPIRDFQSPIDPSAKAPWRWLSEWLIEYAQAMGQWMDTPESISPESIKTFYDAESYHMQDYPVPAEGWKTFNEFFARHIDPAVRPIASPSDDKVIVSPADCTFDGTWPVDPEGAHVNTFDVKGVPWAISQLLDDPNFGPLFGGGTFTHSFLGPNDYHRQHAPVSGTVVEAKVIPGVCFLEVILEFAGTVSKGGATAKPTLGMHRPLESVSKAGGMSMMSLAAKSNGTDSGSIAAPDTPGYQFLQARGLILIDNPTLGLVAVLPIGMAQVSSVVLSVSAGQHVQKGQEISCFAFGGSDIVMVFQKDAQVKFHQEKNKHYKFGEAVATSNSYR